MIKTLKLGDENVAGRLYNDKENFAIVTLTEKVEGINMDDIPYELRDLALVFKTKESLDNFIDWLSKIRRHCTTEWFLSKFDNKKEE